MFLGLSVGDEKPSTDVFFNPIIIQLKKLELGINIEIENENVDVKFFVVAGVMDKPAKAALLNMISSIGFYGCTKCLQPGKSHKATDSNGEETGMVQFQKKISYLWVVKFFHGRVVRPQTDSC